VLRAIYLLSPPQDTQNVLHVTMRRRQQLANSH
jgi:hypothetical protein